MIHWMKHRKGMAMKSKDYYDELKKKQKGVICRWVPVKGDRVNYSSIIGEPPDSFNHEVLSIFLAASGRMVAFISGKRAHVAIEALTKYEESAMPLHKAGGSEKRTILMDGPETVITAKDENCSLCEYWTDLHIAKDENCSLCAYSTALHCTEVRITIGKCAKDGSKKTELDHCGDFELLSHLKKFRQKRGEPNDSRRSIKKLVGGKFNT